jgi:tripartite-type tricarboxylate transporter receptor subunit TctC
MLRALTHSLALLAGLCLSGAASAQSSVEAFYKGRTISLVMGTGPGGSYDLYGRLVADHLGKFIPGKPNIVIEHMPGAAGAVAANFLYNVAAQDGSKLLLTHSLPLIEKLYGEGVRYDSRKFQWLGAYDEISQMLALWHTSAPKSLSDLKGSDFVLGSMGRSHLSYQWAALLKEAMDAKFRVIPGYPTGGSLNLAMERGEIAGWVVAWESLAPSNWVQDKRVYVPVQFTLKRMAELPDVPTIIELSEGENKKIAEFLAAGTPHARGLALGPGVPADRVAAMRDAFDAMVKDEAFLADAKKRGLAISPRNYKELNALTELIVTASPDFVAKVKKMIGE